jgi:glycosyltransferase involved in cell wall biosynthesis
MSEPTVSVIIHFLNAERHSRDSVRSVLWQTLEGWELLLVDGGSSDKSVEIAREMIGRCPGKVRVYRHEGPGTLGIFSSRVWGAREARAPILAHLDSDDEWHPRFLERQYGIYRTSFASSRGMVYCPMVYWWEDHSMASQS